MLEGIEGLKLIKEDYYYSLNDMGVLLLTIGIILSVAGVLFYLINIYSKKTEYIFGIIVIIGMVLIINGFVFGKDEYKKYTLTPIEENYYIDLDKYSIDNEKSNNNLIVIRER